jgi:hypothetical protein
MEFLRYLFNQFFVYHCDTKVENYL